ncbi:MAG: M24 family metallopeptidase [Granulosicoccaceae bacterium]
MSETLKARLPALRQRMLSEGSDLLVIGPGSHMQYLLGFYPHPDERVCLLMISSSAALLLCPALNANEAAQQTDIPLVRWNDEDGPAEALQHALSALSASDSQCIAVDETMRADFALLVLDSLPGAKHVFSDNTVGWMRMRKDEDEYRRLKMNALIDDSAMRCAATHARAGMTERELTSIIREHFAEQDARTEFAIVATGANGAHPHHAPDDTVIQPGDAIVVDIGSRKDGVPSDMTRMIAIGEPPEGYEEVHAIVQRANKAALAAAKPGVAASVVDAAARDVITEAGYGEYFTHRTGHGLGLDIHEPPYITATSDVILDEGMVFSIEPGIYLPGRFGIRLEDIVILRAEGAEVLSELPLDLLIAG